MRRIVLPVLAAVMGLPAARSADLRHFGDAALHAVQFVDADEGWAVGDDGVVWHSLDGGRNWERQPTGVRASLRAVHFLDPSKGWIAGREELPHGAGSAGVLLYTRDGGVKWQCVSSHALPGLNGVRFVDARHGFVLGDGSEQYATGVFQTTDGGRTWKPMPGRRVTAWRGGDFAKDGTGLLAGAWGRLTALRPGVFMEADVDPLGGRNVHAVRFVGQRAVAVGQGGLVLVAADSAAMRWGYANLPVSPETLASLDFRALACQGNHLWIAGRPGSAILHSTDQGQSWQLRSTGQPLALNGMYFQSERRGWAVGELGCILATEDGGKNWQVQRRGGQRAAVLLVHGLPAGFPLETVAHLGGQSDYLVAGMQVLSADPASAPATRATDSQRLAAAMRQAGGAAGEAVWQFPLPQHLGQAGKRELIAAWDRLHADRAADQLLGQLVLSLRMWRPDCVVTDSPTEPGQATESLIGEAVQEACRRAGDPQAYPEQLEHLKLSPWKVSKLYSLCEEGAKPQVAVDATVISPRLEATLRDFATPAAGLLADAPTLPAQRGFRLIESRLDGAASHRDLMQGLPISAPGVDRRPPVAVAALPPETEQALRSCRTLQAMTEAPVEGLADANRLLAQIQPTIAKLPDDSAARALFRVAGHYARLGQWAMAREVHVLLVSRYPAHPLAVDASRWLIQHGTSSEARRRLERSQYVLATQVSSRAAQTALPDPKKSGMTIQSGVDVFQERQLGMVSSLKEARQWYQQSLDLGGRLAALGPVFAADPSIQFCLQSARRHLGDVETAREWYAQFRSEHPSGPWGEAAAAELWLANRNGQPPRPVAFCRQTPERPFLDGKLVEECWQGGKPLVLGNATGDTVKEYPAEVRLAYDQDFLYVGLRCRHPADRYVPPVKGRTTDADVRTHDRISLLLDLDRDYATYYHLQVDQRGWVYDDCWGDRTWNPRWFVAVHSDAEAWQVEAAIPLVELTGEPITVGRSWAFNVVRVLPGRGVQAWSAPADVQPRPEGMGILMFLAEPRAEKRPP